VTLSTSLSLGDFSMARGPIGRNYFLRQLWYHKKRFARIRSDKQAYNKIVDKCQFFIRNAQALGIAVIFDRKKKIFKSKRIKVEEEGNLESDTFYVSVPYGYLPKLPSSHAS
jgi:hypothetical protein